MIHRGGEWGVVRDVTLGKLVAELCSRYSILPNNVGVLGHNLPPATCSLGRTVETPFPDHRDVLRVDGGLRAPAHGHVRLVDARQPLRCGVAWCVPLG